MEGLGIHEHVHQKVSLVVRKGEIELTQLHGLQFNPELMLLSVRSFAFSSRVHSGFIRVSSHCAETCR